MYIFILVLVTTPIHSTRRAMTYHLLFSIKEIGKDFMFFDRDALSY